MKKAFRVFLGMIKGIGKLVLFTIILMVVMVASALITLNYSFFSTKQVNVPNIVGLNLLEAYSKLNQVGLEIKEKGRSFSNVVGKDCIISQDPMPGKVVREGRKILVEISEGSQSVPTPQLIGKHIRDMEATLAKGSFEQGQVSYISSASPVGTVIAQEPLPGEIRAGQTKINLLVSQGKEKTRYVMPDLRGLQLRAADKILSTLLCSYETRRVKDPTKPENIVLDQKPLPNQTLQERSTVELTVNVTARPLEESDMRYGAVDYQIPAEPADAEYYLRVVCTDGAGKQWTDYSGAVKAGTRFQRLIEYSGKMKVEIYVNDQPRPAYEQSFGFET